MLNQKKPPKEGTKSEKLIHEENVRTLRFYRYLFLSAYIPMRLFYVLWVNILSPWIFDPNQEVQVNEKKQKKMERKMRRVGHLMHVTERGVGRAN
ncbi:Transmembrane protein 208 [Schistosoma japonicum]|nr:Transmembrane protein 208 [Schistosoma japonicum]